MDGRSPGAWAALGPTRDHKIGYHADRSSRAGATTTKRLRLCRVQPLRVCVCVASIYIII
jgi:hypothetical protein